MELLVSGSKFDDYTIESVLSNHYEYRAVYRVTLEDGKHGVLVVYDMDAYKGKHFFLFGMWVPSEFYYAYRLQRTVSPEVYDVGENHRHGKLCWMCQAYVAGLDLGTFMSMNMCGGYEDNKDLAMAMCALMCRFNGALPRCGHYNLTPDNFIIVAQKSGEKYPVLIGLQHLDEDGTEYYRHPENSYSLIYKAPEMLTGTYTISSDVYAMAVIFCELLTDSLPWDCGCWEKQKSFTLSKMLLSKIRHGQPTVEGVPEEVKNVLLHGLLSKTRRYANLQQFHLALRDALSEEEEKDEMSGEHIISILKDDVEDSSGNDESDDTDDDETPLMGPDEMGRPKSRSKMTKKKGDGFAAVAGMDQLKSDLTQNFINVLRYSDMAKTFGIQPPNGMLLYGPPGCGKTYLASRLAEEVGINVSFVRPSDLGSTFIHGSQTMIADLFAKAEKNAPSMLVFDEIDALVPSRAIVGESAGYSGEVNEFLTQLESCSERGIFVVGTTNRIEQIDPAVLRTGRIEEVVYVPLPDRDNRLALIKMELKGKPCKSDIDYERLADLTERFTMSDVSYAMKKACRMAFDKAVTQGMGLHTRIDMALLEKAISETMPSVDLKSEQEFERQRHEHEGRRKVADVQNHQIGFRASHV